MIEHIIFDLDGTLVDSASVCVDIINEMLAGRGADAMVSRAEALPHMSSGGEAMVAALLGAACLNPTDEIGDFRRIYAAKRTPDSSVFAGVHLGLAKLRTLGLTLSICSNKPQHLCENVLNDLGLADFFDVIVGGCSQHRPKPAPDLLDCVLDRVGVPADRCIYVGDSELDHAVAIKCGVPFIFANYGYAAAEWRFHGSARFDHFSDIVAAITDAHRESIEVEFEPRRQASR